MCVCFVGWWNQSSVSAGGEDEGADTGSGWGQRPHSDCAVVAVIWGLLIDDLLKNSAFTSQKLFKYRCSTYKIWVV